MKTENSDKKYVKDWYLGAVNTLYLGRPVDLVKGEVTQLEYSNGFVLLVFTNKRVIVRSIDKTIPREIIEDDYSLPYKSITMWTVKRYGSTGIEEFVIGTSSGEIMFRYIREEDVKEFEEVLVRECARG